MYDDLNKSVVLVTGGTGFVGEKIVNELIKNGYEPRILTRNKSKSIKKYHVYWNPLNEKLPTSIWKNVKHIIHLAGANIINKPWTTNRKNELINSRVSTIEFLLNSYKESDANLLSISSASAIGYYGFNSKSTLCKESDKAGTDFAAQLCVKWENVFAGFENEGVKVKRFRISMVLGDNSTIVKVNRLFLKFRLKLILGNGNQPFPWVGVSDLARVFVASLTIGKEQVYNLVNKQKYTLEEFIDSVANPKKKYVKLYLPSFFIKFTLGDRANLILKGNQISHDLLYHDFQPYLLHDNPQKWFM